SARGRHLLSSERSVTVLGRRTRWRQPRDSATPRSLVGTGADVSRPVAAASRHRGQRGQRRETRPPDYARDLGPCALSGALVGEDVVEGRGCQNALGPAGEIFVGGGLESSGDVVSWVSKAQLELAQEQFSLAFLAAFLASLLGAFPGEFLSSGHVGLLSDGSNQLGELMDVVWVSIGGDGNILQEQA